MPVSVQQSHPIAHWPLVLGVLRRLEVALKALEGSASPTPWLPQDTTTMVLYGASEDEPQTPGAPRPAYGQSKDGRDDLTPGLLSLGVRGESGVPLRLGGREGNRSERVEPPPGDCRVSGLGLGGGAWDRGGESGLEAPHPGGVSRAQGRFHHVRPASLCHPPGPRSLGPAATCVAPGSSRSPGGRRTKRPGAGMATACSARWRSHTGMGAAPRRPGALASYMRVHWPSSTPRPMPLPRSKTPKPWQTTCGRCQPAGAPASPMPQRLSPRLRARGRDTAGAVHACGGLLRSALTAWQSPAARDAPGGDGRRSWPHRRESRAIASWSRSRRWPRRKRTMGGRCWPPRSTLRSVLRPTCSRPIKTKIPRWNRACAGSSMALW
jgi:hypothetical protein